MSTAKEETWTTRRAAEWATLGPSFPRCAPVVAYLLAPNRCFRARLRRHPCCHRRFQPCGNRPIENLKFGCVRLCDLLPCALGQSSSTSSKAPTRCCVESLGRFLDRRSASGTRLHCHVRCDHLAEQTQPGTSPLPKPDVRRGHVRKQTKREKKIIGEKRTHTSKKKVSSSWTSRDQTSSWPPVRSTKSPAPMVASIEYGEQNR